MKIYLAGPMRGIPKWNYPAFDEAEKRLRLLGFTVFSPASIDRAFDYGSNDHPPEVGKDHLKHVILTDVGCILFADGIALLPGWERSRGVAVELALAQFLGLKVFDAMTMEMMDLPLTPWGLKPAPNQEVGRG